MTQNRDYMTEIDPRTGETLPNEVPATCPDCGTPTFYDSTDEAYHHAVRPEHGCFLIPSEDRPQDSNHPLFKDYTSFPRATVEFQNDDYMAEIFPNRTNSLFRLHWTDYVTGDWEEFFYSMSAALCRLALLESCRANDFNRSFKSSEAEFNAAAHTFLDHHMTER